MNALLVDGSALAYRAYFAFERNPLATSSGEPTSVPFAFLATLWRWIQRYEPDAVAVVFDAPGPTHRHREFPAYKAHRPPRPAGLTAQMPRLHEALRALRVAVVELAGWEADDVLATLARGVEASGGRVLLASGDKDFRQLVSVRVRLVRPGLAGRADEEIGPEELRRDSGISPAQVVDVMALTGDAVDNIPGVAGIGEKTALRLVAAHGDLDTLYAHLERIEGAAIRRRLEVGRESAYRSRALVRLRTDAPLDPAVALPAWPGPDWPVLRALCQELELVQLQRAFRGPEVVPASTPAITALEALQTLVDSRLGTATTVAFHPVFDTHGEPSAFGLAWGAGQEAGVRLAAPPPPPRPGELDLQLPGGPGIDPRAAARCLEPAFADAARTVVGIDLKETTLVLGSRALAPRGAPWDVGIADFVLRPERRRRDLESLVVDLLPEEPSPAAPGADPAAAAARTAGTLWRLHGVLAPRLVAAGLESWFATVEMPLLVVLREMQRTGVRIDAAALAALGRELEGRATALAADIHERAGGPFNLQSAAQVGQVLFGQLGLPHGRRTRTGWSTDGDVLEKLAGLHPIAAMLLEHRMLSKLRSTWCDALPRLVDPQTGRIHTTFHQDGATTGRLSSSDPNLQNIPIRTQLGRRIRATFVGAPGYVLLSADYSQVELRLLAHLSGDPNLLEAFTTGVDVHAATAARIAGCDVDAVTPAARAAAKTVNFGVLYGMGARGLAERLGIDVEAARRFIDDYFRRFPAVQHTTEDLVARARATGFATTLLGRRLALAEIRSEHPGRRAAAERLAINAPIQGSAADLVKIAMVHVDSRLRAERSAARMLLQVHDELLFEVPEPEVGSVTEIVRQEMQSALALRVPLVVDVGVGHDWAEAH